VRQPGLTVTYRTEPDRVLAVAGELDIGTAPVLRDAFLNLLADEDERDLALDASGVSFVDSSGLAVLLMAARRWAAEERRLVLRTPSPPLLRVIDLTGVRRAFEICE
jgi:anti-sigma B factor antagonist